MECIKTEGIEMKGKIKDHGAYLEHRNVIIGWWIEMDLEQREYDLYHSKNGITLTFGRWGIYASW